MTNGFYKTHAARIFLCLWLIVWLCGSISAGITDKDFFTYAELETLYAQENLSPDLREKLDYLLTTPIVDNSFPNDQPPRFLQSPKLGEFLRVAEWNIERGLGFEAIAAIFEGGEFFAKMLDARGLSADSKERAEIMEEARKLRETDVIVLNEVDFGMKRTDYRRVAAELAARLKMNYAFGVNFVELSPVELSRNLKGETEQEKELTELIRVDPNRYKGLQGIAILSRFPLENVRLIPFKTKPYDWYRSEKNGASLLEKGKQQIADKIFLEKTLREVRRGGRAMLLADIVDAKFPSGRVTIAATHLENRTKSKNRVKQIEELLAVIKPINNPVVVAGDMNTSSADLTPTSLKRELAKRYGSPGFWIKQGVSWMLGFGLVESTVLDGLTFWRTQADPTVRNIPILMPNSEHKFFSTLKKFRFADGGAFDFRGDKEHSVNDKKRTLANSNERGTKGFVTTFQVTRPIKFIGKYKLDWIFVKPAALKNPVARRGSFRFAPHFGQTLTEVNEITEDRVSDHRPIIVDLPLNEPLIK